MEVIWLASVHFSVPLLLHCSRQLHTAGCTPVPATVSITVPFLKAHRNMRVSLFSTFKNMWVHTYTYFRLLFNIKNLCKISKPPYIIIQCTRIFFINLQGVTIITDTGRLSHCKQSVLRMDTMLPCILIYYPVMDPPYWNPTAYQSSFF
jgi:hypothetical protein